MRRQSIGSRLRRSSSVHRQLPRAPAWLGFLHSMWTRRCFPSRKRAANPKRWRKQAKPRGQKSETSGTPQWPEATARRAWRPELNVQFGLLPTELEKHRSYVAYILPPMADCLSQSKHSQSVTELSLLLAGEIGNSNASRAETLKSLWPRLAELGLNTVLVPGKTTGLDARTGRHLNPQRERDRTQTTEYDG